MRTYLGMLASHQIPIARAFGTAALLLFGCAVVLTFRRDPQRRRPLVPWLLLAIYAGVNGVGTSVARLGFGETMALSSRYASLPALFWLGTLMTLALTALGSSRPRRRTVGLGLVAAVSVCLLVPMAAEGVTQLRHQLQDVRRQPLGALAMLWRVADPQALRSVGFGPRNLQQSRDFFERRGHIPYDRLDDWALGEKWTGGEQFAPPTAVGSWESTDAAIGRVLRVSGRLASPPPVGSRILLLDERGRVWGGGVFVPRHGARPAPLFAGSALPPVWFGYLLSECAGPISAFVEFPGDSRLVPLTTALGAAFSCREPGRSS